jgi:hypothetical protein
VIVDDHPAEFLQAACHNLEYGLVTVQRGFLCQVGNPHPRAQPQFAVISTDLPADDAQQRGLPFTIAANQAYALTLSSSARWPKASERLLSRSNGMDESGMAPGGCRYW